MLTSALLIIAACVLVLSAVVFLWVFNYQLLLLSKGFPGRSETVITEGTDASGKEFRMIGNSSEGKHTALAVVKKGFLGIWHYEQYTTERNAETGQIVVSSLDVIPELPGNKTTSAIIIVYAGNNAIRDLPDFSDLPDPEHSTVEVSQNGEWYTVCIKWQGKGFEYNGFSLYSYMKERGLVK